MAGVGPGRGPRRLPGCRLTLPRFSMHTRNGARQSVRRPRLFAERRSRWRGDTACTRALHLAEVTERELNVCADPP
jgi:hypothetical protein